MDDGRAEGCGKYGEERLMVLTSIREFCEVTLPILMFDKDGKLIVMKLEQVYLLSIYDSLRQILIVYSCFLCLLVPNLFLHQDPSQHEADNLTWKLSHLKS